MEDHTYHNPKEARLRQQPDGLTATEYGTKTGVTYAYTHGYSAPPDPDYKYTELHSVAELAERLSGLKPGEMLSVAVIEDGDPDA